MAKSDQQPQTAFRKPSSGGAKHPDELPQNSESLFRTYVNFLWQT
jgi:hypothetical protein